MKNKHHLLYFSLFSILIISAVIASCKRINSFTDLGGGLIPAVDNINTFDTVMDAEAFNHIFLDSEDSLRVFSSDLHFLGTIQNDPFFGKTDAKLYLQLKPSTFPFAFARTDSLTIDSVVLVLDYRGTYGDSTLPQTINAYEITEEFREDSSYLVREKTFAHGTLLGTTTVIPANLDDSVKVFRDTTDRQLRVKLNNSFGQRLLDYDSVANGAYHSDSLFNTFLRGFALESSTGSGNALMAFSLASSANTKLAIYYRYPKSGVEDTTVSYFVFNEYNGFSGCGHHNYIKRDFSGTPLEAAANSPTTDNYLYLINTPGSYATVTVPGLDAVSNRLVHRAELVIEQIHDNSDKDFSPPGVIWLDAKKSTDLDYSIIPYDVFPDGSTGQLNYGSFGAYGHEVPDGAGNTVIRWNFDLTRYVQKIVTEHQPVMDFRLIAHRYLTDSLKSNNYANTGSTTAFSFPVNTSISVGRVRVGGTGLPANQKIRLYIVYSKI